MEAEKGVDGRYYRILLNQADTKTEQKLSEKVASMLPGNLQWDVSEQPGKGEEIP